TDVRCLLPKLESAIAGAELTPTEAARRLLALLDSGDDSAPAGKSPRRGRSGGLRQRRERTRRIRTRRDAAVFTPALIEAPSPSLGDFLPISTSPRGLPSVGSFPSPCANVR